MKLVLLSFLLCLSSLASTKSEINDLMQDYLQSLRAKNQKKTSTLVSNNFLRKLQAQKVFSASFEQSNNIKKISFDIIINKANMSKETYFVNIKDKKTKEYNDYWYVVKKYNTQFIIEEMQMIEQSHKH